MRSRLPPITSTQQRENDANIFSRCWHFVEKLIKNIQIKNAKSRWIIFSHWMQRHLNDNIPFQIYYFYSRRIVVWIVIKDYPCRLLFVFTNRFFYCRNVRFQIKFRGVRKPIIHIFKGWRFRYNVYVNERLFIL